ncbi:unnamed protein product, partial [Prorocentrum cordatum]
ATSTAPACGGVGEAQDAFQGPRDVQGHSLFGPPERTLPAPPEGLTVKASEAQTYERALAWHQKKEEKNKQRAKEKLVTELSTLRNPKITEKSKFLATSYKSGPPPMAERARRRIEEARAKDRRASAPSGPRCARAPARCTPRCCIRAPSGTAASSPSTCAGTAWAAGRGGTPTSTRTVPSRPGFPRWRSCSCATAPSTPLHPRHRAQPRPQRQQLAAQPAAAERPRPPVGAGRPRAGAPGERRRLRRLRPRLPEGRRAPQRQQLGAQPARRA